MRKRFGDAIRQTALEELIRETWERAREQESLQPIGDPQVRNLKFEDGAPLSFELLVDVRPEITLDRLGGFRLSRHLHRVTDEQVEAQLLAVREQKAPWLPVDRAGQARRPRRGDDREPRRRARDRGARSRCGSSSGRAGRCRELEDAGDGDGRRRDVGGRHPLPRRPSRRGAARPDPPGPGDPARGQAAGAPGADRRLRPRGRHLRDGGRPAGRRSAATSRRRAGARADAELRAAARRAARGGEQRRGPAVAARPGGARLRQGVRRPGGPAVAVRRARWRRSSRPACGATSSSTPWPSGRSWPAPRRSWTRGWPRWPQRRNETPGVVYAALEKAGRLRELERSITEEKVFAHLLALSEIEDAHVAH